ncbi:MAG: Crp/Fnr family transcriptional regulator [Acutalibacteraceae bacterium]
MCYTVRRRDRRDGRGCETTGAAAFWTALSAAERDMAARAAFLRRYDRGQPIYEGGSGCLGLVCVVSGGVRAYLLSEEGREVTLFRLAPGDVCVLSASCVIQQITFDLHGFIACELLVLPAEAFERLEDSCEAVRSFVHVRTAERFSAAMEAVQRLLFERFDRRLAGFLLAESEKNGVREVRMTHEELARQLSSAREVVARTLKRFADAGLVELRRGAVRLTDPARLRALAASS